VSYSNPVLPGFHPDPSVCRAGNEYFLVTSSFTYFPGVPIFRSTNLIDWTQIGNVLDRPSQLDLSATAAWSSLGVHAPTLRYHDGRFWMITTNGTTEGFRNFFVTAEDPAGPWTDPTLVPVGGIDPDLAWDAEGACWVTFSSGKGIEQCRIDDRTGELLGGPTRTWSGTGLQYPEAPHLFERAGTWYLLLAEGGTERGHAVSIARGPSLAGPWEGCPSNPILSHRSTDRPIQNTGHADLVEAVDGSWWMVLLGVRPRGMTPGFHVLGRETFLAPVEWVDGWPMVDELALTMTTRPPGRPGPTLDPVRDDFDTSVLHPRWVSVRRPLGECVSLSARPGWLTLRGTSAELDDPEPVFLGRRQQHHRCRVRTRLETEGRGEAGLTVRMDERSHYDVVVRGNEVVARACIGPLESVVGTAEKPPGAVVLGIDIDTETAVFGPDVISLGFEDTTGGFTVLAALDGRYLSTEVSGGFLGRVIGMHAVGTTAAFDWFDYEYDDGAPTSAGAGAP
jgi:xylan 1,4-beta-xylosidase